MNEKQITEAINAFKYYVRKTTDEYKNEYGTDFVINAFASLIEDYKQALIDDENEAEQ